MQDIKNRNYNYIDNSVKIDFELTNTMADLINKAEEADLLNDYGLYMNLVYAIDSQGKNEVNKNIINETEWKTLLRRYQL